MATKKATQVQPAKPKLDSDEAAVIEMIATGTGYRAIAAKYGVSIGSVHAWINAIPERSHVCAKARELAAFSEDERAFEEIAAASDPFELAKAKEMAIHRRWRAKSLNPQKYGDKVEQTLQGPNGGPVSLGLQVVGVRPS
jgi:hypothetical protein